MNPDQMFFQFAKFEDEISRRNKTLALTPCQLFEVMCTIYSSTCPFENFVDSIRNLWSIQQSFEFKHGGPGYLSHPVRVAGSLIKILPDVGRDDILLALTHNLCEQTGADIPQEVRSVVGEKVTHSIRVLTIDRHQEHDPVYMEQYYRGIAELGKEVILLKAIDKLDNLLGWTSKVVNPFYFNVIRDYVCPMVAGVDKPLAVYIEELLGYVAERAPEWKGNGK